jgi:hypothetical protein
MPPGASRRAEAVRVRRSAARWFLATSPPRKLAVALSRRGRPGSTVAPQAAAATFPHIRATGCRPIWSAVASSWRRRVAIWIERIAHDAGLGVKRALREPGLPRRLRCDQAGDFTETGEDVVGSDGWLAMPYDHLQYRI